MVSHATDLNTHRNTSKNGNIDRCGWLVLISCVTFNLV